MSIIRNIFDLLCFMSAWAWTLICALFAIPAFRFYPPLGHKIHHAFGRGCLWLMGIKVEVIGTENLKPRGAIWAPNHESLFDIPLLSSLPEDFAWISKAEVQKIPFIAGTMHAMGCYFVNRDRSARDLNLMKEVEAGLRNGSRLVIFPEGTRTRTGELLPFKKGAFRTAKNSGVPLIPIAIRGTRNIAKPGKLPSVNHRVTVTIGEPYWISPEKSVAEGMAEYREILSKLLAKGN
jgi:1-acyl-sn-glycerol-3-phosphate acyltransferase